MQRKFLENRRKIVTMFLLSVRGQCYLRAAARMSFINLTAPGASSCIVSTCAPSRTFCRGHVRVCVHALKYIRHGRWLWLCIHACARARELATRFITVPGVQAHARSPCTWTDSTCGRIKTWSRAQSRSECSNKNTDVQGDRKVIAVTWWEFGGSRELAEEPFYYPRNSKLQFNPTLAPHLAVGL